MTVDVDTDYNLDAVFTEVGEFGLFHIISYFLLCLPNIIQATHVTSYVFTSTTLEHRCKVPECDPNQNNREIQFDQPWLSLAIPSSNHTLENCYRYAPINADGAGQCSAELFDTTKQIKCTEYVYKTDEKNIQTEFNMHCSDTFQLGMVGTMNSVGRFIFMPLTGFLSDKYGRLTVIIVGVTFSCIFGLIKSFSVSYMMYLILEFLESSAGACTFPGSYVLGLEWASTKYRVIGSSIITLTFPIGEILLGLIAMYIHDFRYLLRVIYTPGLLVIFYYWLVPESVRWLLITGRVDRAINILKRTASINNQQLSGKSIESLKLQYDPAHIKNSATDKLNNNEKPSLFQTLGIIIKSKRLSMRLISGCYVWMACAFCFYGLGLTATHISGTDRYISFIVVAAVEIPGLLLSVPLLKCVPRRRLMFILLLIPGLTTIATAIVPKEHSAIVLVLFMLGKGSVTCAFSVLYVFTAEVWPTSFRTTLMNSNSMIGRIGGMIAPMTPLLAQYFDILPFLLFGGSAILAAFAILLFPETINKKLPDTIDEAKQLCSVEN